MRAVIVLLCVLPLALSTPVEVASQPDPVMDLAQMVQNLFLDRQDRAITDDNEEADDVSADDDKKDNLPMVIDSSVIRKYNDMVDTIYKKMNQALRAKQMDPMVLDINKARAKLNKQEKKKEAKKADKKRKHSVEKREADEAVEAVEEAEDEAAEVVEAELDHEVGDARKMNPKHKVQKAKKDKKKKKKEMHKNKNNKKDAEKKKKKDDDKKNKNKDKKDEDKKNKHKNKPNKDKKKEDKPKKKEDKDEKKHHNKNKKHHNKNKKEHMKNKHQKEHNMKHKNKREAEKSAVKEMGSLSGIASLQRFGDVAVSKGDDFEVIRSEFTLGPLNLEVTKSNGGSKNVKVARAVTEKLKGKMVIKVNKDGSATVRSVKFEKPKQVDVRGSLGLKSDESEKLAERSITRLRPVAAKRLLKLARTIMKNRTSVQKQ